MESPDVDCYGEVALSRQAATRGDQDYGLSLPAEETHRNDETLRYHGPLPLDHFNAAGVHRHRASCRSSNQIAVMAYSLLINVSIGFRLA